MEQAYKRIMANIRSRRKELGLTQTQLADKCGIKQSNYSRMESGKQMPSLETLMTILYQLHMDMDFVPVDYYVYDVMNKDELVCVVELSKDRKKIRFDKKIPDGLSQPFCGEKLDLERFYSFLKSRCYEDGRADLKEILKQAHMTSNNPYEFIKLSHGVNYSDTFWIKMHDENLSWEDVRVI
ncbi:helix-turn-helix domain-containing protein [Butyrivibrio proteoclasticus]|uniref:helix-turn-helix domain-containing protein n=1 Tax=Butyrivibrio proteoclasticus TaxID=43305 RepID=UPI0005586790|nr:helix-turn-helix transcriptional regulator [Butyrivibrio proteoclasticus]